MKKFRVAVALFLTVLLLVPLVSAGGGQAPSGVGDRIEVGVERSFDNWLRLKIRGLKSLNPFDPGNRLESKGVTRVG